MLQPNSLINFIKLSLNLTAVLTNLVNIPSEKTPARGPPIVPVNFIVRENTVEPSRLNTIRAKSTFTTPNIRAIIM